MSLAGKLFSVYSTRCIKTFDKAAGSPVDSQLAVLRELLKTAKNTEWGRKYGYGDLPDPEEFRKRVPVMDYETMAPEWHRAFEGDRNVTWPGHTRYFALSSGTTAGNKLLPVSGESIASNLRSGGYLISLMVRRGGPEKISCGKFLYLGGPTALRKRNKCLYGDASGIISKHIPFYVRHRHLPDRKTAAIIDWEEKTGKIVEKYARAKICAVSGCPSWVSLLFGKMQEKYGKPVGEIWPELSFFVSYGMSFEPYRKTFESLIGRPVYYVDTYSSSEGGMTAIAGNAGEPMRLIVDNGVFFEFIPAGKTAGQSPPRLHLGEVEEGVEYSLLLNTNSGIWAYPLGDVIRFESLSPPVVRFVGRTSTCLSAFGEHVTVEMLEKAVVSACEATSSAVRDYSVCPRFPATNHPVPAHRWVVEFEKRPEKPNKFMRVVDETIRNENEDYDTHRTNDFGMVPPVLCEVPRDAFYLWMQSKGQLGAQHKVPRVICEEDFRKLTGQEAVTG